MAIRRKKLDVNTKNALIYAQESSMNRGVKRIDVRFFLYAIFKSCREYIEPFISTDKINEICSTINEEIPDGDGNPIDFDQVKYSQEISDYIHRIEESELDGIGSIINDIFLTDIELGKVIEKSGITIVDIESLVGFEIEQSRNNINGQTPSFPYPLSGINISESQKRSSKDRKREKAGKSIGSGDFDISEFCTDLTDLARDKKIGDVFCREKEIASIIISLMRKMKPNPMLVGEPGVGKTAIVEGLAGKIASGQVPESLKNATIMSLDVSSVVGGTTYRGDFEKRMKNILFELQSREDIILFIDEVHMIVGAGDNHGNMDAGNILKPYLARGDIRCIGATTHYEYNKFLKKDGALTRRFQQVDVKEVSKEQTMEILEGLKSSFENHHGVKISTVCLKKIVDLTDRFISGRYFPDKAIDCLDETCARASIMQMDSIDTVVIEESISSLSAIPVSVIRTEDNRKIEKLREHLKENVLGNNNAIDKYCDTIRAKQSSIIPSSRPLCSMVVCGPEGIGKHTVFRNTSEILYGTNHVVMINGSEYADNSSNNKIAGSAPGYVGYSDESYLLKEVKRKPYSIIVINDFELMDNGVKELFLGIMKTGLMKDGMGIEIDFRNATLIFCVDIESKGSALGFSLGESSLKESDEEVDIPSLSSILKLADATVKFSKVEKSIMRAIVELEIEKFENEYRSAGVDVDVDNELVDLLYNNHIDLLSPSEIRSKIRKDLDFIMSEQDKDVDKINLNIECFKEK